MITVIHDGGCPFPLGTPIPIPRPAPPPLVTERPATPTIPSRPAPAPDAPPTCPDCGTPVSGTGQHCRTPARRGQARKYTLAPAVAVVRRSLDRLIADLATAQLRLTACDAQIATLEAELRRRLTEVLSR